MVSPFPGMNPYLENPELWSGVHGRLIVAIADFLSPQLRPKYFVAIEERIYETTSDDAILVGVPDVMVRRQANAISTSIENNLAITVSDIQPATVTLPIPEVVKERYLEVRKVATKEVVTVIEILSPKNKRAGVGRDAYENKRLRVLGSSTHLVEVDLLRGGKAMPILNNNIKSDYRILVSRSQQRPQGDLYAFNLQNSIPTFPLPLREENLEPVIDLQTLVNDLYDRASYDLVIDYTQEPVPALPKENAVWLDELLQKQGLR